MLSAFLNVGARDDIVEVAEKRLLPAFFKLLRLKGRAERICRQRAHLFRARERIFRAAVSELDAALRRIAAGKDGIQFMIDDGKFFADRFGLFEILVKRGEFERREDGPRFHFWSRRRRGFRRRKRSLRF